MIERWLNVWTIVKSPRSGLFWFGGSSPGQRALSVSVALWDTLQVLYSARRGDEEMSDE
jgi:hypothetical protein